MLKYIKCALNFLNYIYSLILFKMFGVNYGGALIINGRIKVFNRGKIEIGNNVTINSSFNSNPIGGDSFSSLITSKNGEINIGNNVGISNSYIYSVRSITIEDNVMIGGGCKIYDTDFHSISFKKRMSEKDQGLEASVIIKNGVFIGTNSIILKGCIIGSHSVIAAGSVVTKNVPDNELWGGNPAKFIKKISNDF